MQELRVQLKGLRISNERAMREREMRDINCSVVQGEDFKGLCLNSPHPTSRIVPHMGVKYVTSYSV